MTRTSRNLLIRADSNSQIGAGHVMRCLAIAQAWIDECGRVLFVAAELPDALQTRLIAEGCSVARPEVVVGTSEDAESTTTFAAAFDADWIVLDGYRLGCTFQDALSSSARRLLIDDHGEAGWFDADIVVNQNLHADADLYRDADASVPLLLGPRYAMLRREFCGFRPRVRDFSARPIKLLVTLGGADPGNATLSAVQAINRLDPFLIEARVIVGSSNPHLTLLREAAGDNPRISLLNHVDDMPAMMDWADVAISSGGGTVWELAHLGVPTLVGAIVAHQVLLTQSLEQHGLFRSLGPFADLTAAVLAGQIETFCASPTELSNIAERAARLIDGEGVHRIMDALRATERQPR